MNKEQKIQSLVQHYQVPFVKEKRTAWEELNSKLNSEPKTPIIPIYRKKWFSTAASLLLVAIISTVLTNNIILTKKYLTENTQRTIILPDNSMVTLNPNSKLKVKYGLISGKRKLELNGEALFNVEEGKPFSVKIPKGKVEVLGTIFTINAYSDKKPVINCIEGSVKVVVKKNEAVIKSGESTLLDKTDVFKTISIDVENVVSELNGDYSWNSKPLNEIFSTIQNRFAYKVNAESSIQNRRFTGKIAVQDLISTCDVLSFALDLKYTINEESKTIVFESIN